MAAPVITCPACTKKFKGKEGIEGKRIKCPLCATPFVVPGNSQVKAGPPPGKQAEDDGMIKLRDEDPAPASQQAQDEQRVSWDPADDDGRAYDLGEFDERARCPNCANLMESEKAVICLYCGYNTMTREWGKTTKTMGISAGQHFVHLLPGIFFVIMILLFVIGILFFALQLPKYIAGTWASFLDHESMRMWINGLALAFMWAFGIVAFKRLVLKPKPAEKEKE